MTAYSITPEGATEAAAEIYWAERKDRSAVSWCNINDIAAIILRHAEQSPEGMKTPWCLNGHEVLTPGCESCLLDLQKRYNDALRKVQGEGEMREALRKLITVIRSVSNLDDGVFYFNGKYCGELLEPLEQAEVLLGPAGLEEKP